MAPTDPLRRRALRFVVAIGIVSLFADMAYEGARAVNGPYLALLGASGAVVGTVAGLGELVGYGLRFASGRWTDRTGRPWPLAFAGYALNMLAVPVLALAGSWQLAALFMLLERTGKALRNPPRDAMLSQAGHVLGRGFTFGLHETLDRIGATAGPLLAAVVLANQGHYRLAYALLGVPAVAALGALVAARLANPRPHDLEPVAPHAAVHGFPRAYWFVLAGGALLAAGFADFPLLAYHLGIEGVLAPAAIPVLYAYANAVGAACVLGLGRAHDRWGAKALAWTLIVPVAATPLVLLGSPAMVVAGMGAWGFGLAVISGVVKPRIAELVPRGLRGRAYGTFDAAFGLSWFAGSAALGFLYDRSIVAAAALSAALAACAVPLTWAAARRPLGAQAVAGP